MIIDGKDYEQIIVTKDNINARLVTADNKKEVLVIITDDKVVEKNGYKVKLIPAIPSVN